MARLKTRSDIGAQFIALESENRFNYLRNLTPERLVYFIEAFEAGDFRELARTMRAMEQRDDIWKVAAAKARKDVSARKWECAPLDGWEDDPAAAAQADTLRAFYARIRASDYTCRNIHSGVRGLVAGLMRAYNDQYAIYEPVFSVRGGALHAQLTRCPLDWFALRQGRIVYLGDGRTEREMHPGEWIVCESDGVGVACAVIKMVKTIALGDWLVYSGRCGHPGIHGRTSASKGTSEWSEFVAALRKFGREWAAATGLDDVIEKIDLSVSGQLPYPGLVEYANRALASLQRGADLSTISAGLGAGDGASLQGDESELITLDNCATITECLRSQLDPTVIRWHYGDDAPIKAGFRIVPPQRDTLNKDLAIDAQLAAQGVRLSKRDALMRYERREVDDNDPDDAPLTQVREAPAAATARELAPVSPTPAWYANQSPDPSAPSDSPDPSSILARVAALILDGQLPYAQAIKAAGAELAKLGPIPPASQLEEQIHAAMLKAATSAADPTPGQQP